MVLSAVFFSPVGLVIGLIGLAVSIFCIVDVFRHPDWAWQSSGQSRTLWIVLTIVGLFVCWLVVDLIYLLAIRPKVAAAESRGGSGGGPYGASPYGGYTAPPTYGGAPGPVPPGYAPTSTPPGYGAPGGASGGYGAPGAAPSGGIGYDNPGYGNAGYGTPPPAAAPTAPPPPSSPPPGWYPDPAGSGQPRYWNGTAWQ